MGINLVMECEVQEGIVTVRCEELLAYRPS